MGIMMDQERALPRDPNLYVVQIEWQRKTDGKTIRIKE